MARRILRSLVWMAAVAVIWGAGVGTSHEVRAEPYTIHYYPDLFYNFYTLPGYNGATAAMYPAPRPTPPWVGHTYITYQPLLPQEFLYRHHRNYWRQNSNGQWTRVSVTWQ